MEKYRGEGNREHWDRVGENEEIKGTKGTNSLCWIIDWCDYVVHCSRRNGLSVTIIGGCIISENFQCKGTTGGHIGTRTKVQMVTKLHLLPLIRPLALGRAVPSTSLP